MKRKQPKIDRRHPMTLSKETLRTLSDRGLRVGGGAIVSCLLCPSQRIWCPPVTLLSDCY